MFQGLTQGSVLHILYKNGPRVEQGRVLTVNTHMPTFNSSQPMALMNGPVTDVTVQIGNESQSITGLPPHGVVAQFNDKGIFVSEDMSAIIRELESMAEESDQFIKQVPFHENRSKVCRELSLKYQPEKRKEAQQAQEIESIKAQISSMDGKFDKIMEMISAKLGNAN